MCAPLPIELFANGNRTLANVEGSAFSYSVNAASNKLLSVSGPVAQTNQYDAAGNLLSDGTTTYTYNARGRLASASKGGISVTYQINGLGQRVSKTISGATGSSATAYDDSGKLIGEYDSAGNVIEEALYLDDQPIAVLQTGSTAGAVKVSYVYADHLNTPRVITSSGSANTLLWQWDSDPFGLTQRNDNPAALGVFTYHPRFPGQVYDKETGLHYNCFRDYSPAT
jgi:uncharacterized protein RhaS with RHS repeats